MNLKLKQIMPVTILLVSRSMRLVMRRKDKAGDEALSTLSTQAGKSSHGSGR